MAKRRTKKRSNAKNLKPELGPGVSKDIAAIIFAAAALLLVFAAFHFGGTLVSAIFTGLRQVLGFAAYLLPLVFGVLAWLLFQQETNNGKICLLTT